MAGRIAASRVPLTEYFLNFLFPYNNLLFSPFQRIVWHIEIVLLYHYAVIEINQNMSKCSSQSEIEAQLENMQVNMSFIIFARLLSSGLIDSKI